MKINTGFIFKKIGQVTEDCDTEFDYDGNEAYKKKKYHHRDSNWASSQMEIERYVNRLFKIGRKQDKNRMNWARLWGIFDCFLDNFDIGTEWEEQQTLIAYLLGLFLKTKGNEIFEDKTVRLMFDFYSEAYRDREEAEGQDRMAKDCVRRCRVKLKGLNSRLAEKLDIKLSTFDFYSNVKKTKNTTGKL